MESVFLKLVNMSITASYLILAVMLYRVVLKKAPKYIRCILWGLVGLRLVLPFSFKSVLSLIPSAEPLPEEFLYAATPQVNTGITSVNNVLNPVISESLTPADLTSANPTQILSFISSRLWFAGMIIMALYALISYLRLRRRVAVSIPVGRQVRLCDYTDTPFILGFIRPQIYLPSGMPQNTMDHVLAHEMAHLKRKDHWWKPLGFLLLTVYWFNPLMWAAYVLLCRDIELACDEKVVKTLDIDAKKAYSAALLQCSVPRRMITTCPLAFGEVGVKARIKSVLNYKKPAFWVIIIAIIASIIIGLCFLTDPVDKEDTMPSVSEATAESRLATGTYLPTECVYMNPLSSYAAIDLSEDYTYRVTETGFYTDSSAFICNANVDHVDWGWKTVDEAADDLEFYTRWLQSDWASWASESAPQLSENCLYQKLDISDHLLLADDTLYMIHGSTSDKDTELVWAIYKLESSVAVNKDMGSASSGANIYTHEDLTALSGEQLLDLFIANGLKINDDLRSTFTEDEIQELFKSEFEALSIGVSTRNDAMYFDLAEQTKAIYDKIT